MAYEERLVAPLWWWLIGAGFAAGMTISVWAYLGPYFGVPAALLSGGAVIALLGGYGSARLAVDDAAFNAAGARLELEWMGQTRALDGQTTARMLTRDADPRAYLLTRPYIKTAVRIDVADGADPHLYWLVSTRRPGELVAAIEASRRETGRG